LATDHPLSRDIHPDASARDSYGSTNLLDCSIGCHSFTDFNLQANPVVVLPRLRRLRLFERELLPSRTAPLLEKLSIPKTRQVTKTQLATFLHRSSCTLNKLVLTTCTISSHLIAALTAIPSLTHLVLECRPGDTTTQTAFFKAMSISGAPSDICPNLTSIVYGDHIHKFPQKPFLAMVQSRFEPNSFVPSRLSRLRVSFQTDPMKKYVSTDGFGGRPAENVAGQRIRCSYAGYS
jgi:hypothetical protein